MHGNDAAAVQLVELGADVNAYDHEVGQTDSQTDTRQGRTYREGPVRQSWLMWLALAAIHAATWLLA